MRSGSTAELTESDDLGAVDLGIEGSGTVSLATRCLQGSYALMLEAVPRTIRANASAHRRWCRSRSTPPERTPRATARRRLRTLPAPRRPRRQRLAWLGRSGGAGDAQAGSPPPASARVRERRRVSWGVRVGRCAGSRLERRRPWLWRRASRAEAPTGRVRSGDGGMSSGGSRQVTVEARGGGGSGSGGSASAGSGGRGTSGSSTGAGPTVSEPPSPPAPVASGGTGRSTSSARTTVPSAAPRRCSSIGRLPVASYVWFGDRRRQRCWWHRTG